MRRLVRRVLRRGGLPVYADDEHPERLAVLAHAQGRVVEIGCGYRKTSPDFVGVDLVPGGQPGRVGNVKGKLSQADAAALGDHLPLRDGAFDSVVARHNLEHYVDLVGVLREWRRVVRAGGRLVAVVPDEERFAGSTLALDPTHYHAFNEAAVKSLLPLTGWTVDQVGPCIEGWSLLIVAHAS
ncbi:MAG TPA: class I SAM-dependent methyltransferase [Acidimicrobiales bacterium]|nr:class I SAM-dependent methyltransferase [Acidimicrobiales bacterium]